eukprot:TRINITY_DN520_c0_g1_i1.p1 TRINITY_DN520_c0_g1~~TRINITY_DN520_c0_g1_i1.p1  ORF type:complete len:139 (-),score=18.26 TRINITY_DN520_c0_g1_i1:165-581(-)
MLAKNAILAVSAVVTTCRTIGFACKNYNEERPAKPMDNPLCKGASMAALIGPDEGWADHVMRVVELEPLGHSPQHDHPYPHINYFIEGEGVIMMDGVDHKVEAGGCSFVPAGIEHQFRNLSSSMPFKFICIVPKEGHQ